MLCDCLPLRRVADLLNVRVQLVVALAEAGHLEHHKHGKGLKITQAGVDELRWRLALASAA
jgi:excisionase family DNA binding protein